LNTAQPPNRRGREFHRVVLRTRLRRIENESKNLRVSSGGPACKPVKQGEDQDAPQERMEQVEDCRSHDQGEEEQLALGPEQSKRSIEDAIYRIQSSLHDDQSPERVRSS